MSEITLQFCAFQSPMGMAIKWFTQGAVGHVDAVLPDGRLLGAQQQKGLGGAPAGVQIRSPNYGGMTNKLRATFRVTPCEAADFWQFLNEQIGKPYDTTSIEGFVFGRDWRDDRGWFCSELIAAALENSGTINRLVVAPNRVTPEGLLLVCSALVPVAKVSATDT